MNRQDGYAYAKERGYLEEDQDGNFYRLFKSVARLDNLTSTEKIILTVILSYTSQKLEFYMSNGILAEETGMNTTSIFRTIKSLREKQFIKTFYKVKDGKTIGRVVRLVENAMHRGLEQSWNNIEYIEYGNGCTEESEEDQIF